MASSSVSLNARHVKQERQKGRSYFIHVDKDNHVRSIQVDTMARPNNGRYSFYDVVSTQYLAVIPDRGSDGELLMVSLISSTGWTSCITYLLPLISLSMKLWRQHSSSDSLETGFSRFAHHAHG